MYSEITELSPCELAKVSGGNGGSEWRERAENLKQKNDVLSGASDGPLPTGSMAPPPGEGSRVKVKPGWNNGPYASVTIKL